MMLPECDMTRDAKRFSNRIITTITFMLNVITKKKTKARTWFSVFMGLKENKTKATKNTK